MSGSRFALVAGGGTGGHVLPALAVARALSEGRGPNSVELVGSRRGLDSQLVNGSGLPVTLLRGRGFSRKATPSALVSNLFALVELVSAIVVAFAVVWRRRPRVVVAMGGYASVPTSLAAWTQRVPVVLVNIDAVPGAANRLIGRFASAAAVAFENTSLRRAVVTGAPVRDEIVGAARADETARVAARQALGIPPGRRVVGIVGGSLGARRLNEAGLSVAREWEKRSDVALYQVVGKRDARWAREQLQASGPEGLWYLQVEYEARMALFYQAADVVVSRAGANAVAEITVVGVAAVLVPLPNSPGDHQTANARVLERAGAAVVLPDEICDGPHLASELEKLLGDEQLISSMRAAASRLGRPDALERVASLVEQNARPGGEESSKETR